MTCYFNNARETYLLVRVNEDTCDYLNMSKGIVQMVTLSKEGAEHDELKLAPKSNQDLMKNATSLKKSVLPKSPLALAILNQILENTEKDRTDYVTKAEEIMEKQGTTEKKVVKKVKKPSNRNQDGFFALADLARELKLDPRDIRAKFRKAKMEKPEGGWVFPNAEKAKILAIIKGEKVPTEPTPPKKVAKAPVKKTVKKTAAAKAKPAAAKKVTVSLKKAA